MKIRRLKPLTIGITILAGMSGCGTPMTPGGQTSDVKQYMLGRYHEAYTQAYSTWYTATLDPKTGRPPAFDGYWAADIGMPNTKIMDDATRKIPVERSEAAAATNKKEEKKLLLSQEDNQVLKPTDTVEVITRSKIINGVEYGPRMVIYPKLPETEEQK